MGATAHGDRGRGCGDTHRHGRALGVSTLFIARKQSEVVRQRDRARKAVDEMYTQVAEKWLAQQPKLEPLQREFLEKALAFYQEFARERGSDPEARAASALAERGAGDIHQKLGEHTDAERAYRRAVELQQAIVAERPKAPDYRLGLAGSQRRLGFLLRETGRFGESERANRRAVELQEVLVAAFPKVAVYRYELAVSHRYLSFLLRETGRLGESSARSPGRGATSSDRG